MRVLIIGGGIGGLALATFLARDGKEVTLIERSPEWRNIGFGVTIWGIGWKVLQKLGIEDKLSKFGYPVKVVKLLAERTIIELNFKKFASFGGAAMIVPRAKLHEFLIEALPPSVSVMHGMTVSNIEEVGSSIQVTFSNGTSEIFDLVVGAEGVNSKSRDLVTPNSVTYSNWSAIAFWPPDDVPVVQETRCVSYAGRTLCFYPTIEKTFIAIFNYHPSQEKRSAEKFITPFIPYLQSQGWKENHIQEVLSECESYFQDEIRYIRMGAWSKGSLALLGDARHAFVPIIGMGANLALEDAQVLAEELKKIDEKSNTIADALKAYEKRRTPRVNRVRALSRFIEPWFNMRSPLFVAFRNLVAPILPRFVLEWMIVRVLKEKI